MALLLVDRSGVSPWVALHRVVAGVVVAAAAAGAWAQPATPSGCTVQAARAAAAAVPGMVVRQVPDLNPALPAASTGVRWVPAAHGSPAYCLVTGSVVTNPKTRKTANFGLALPPVWNHRFVMSGCGHYCGQVFQGLPTDPHDGLASGNAVAATDDGHASNPPGESLDASWALQAPGAPAADAVADFFYRAVHTVSLAGQQFVKRWYAGPLSYSYFIGCSDGGREGMMEAARYPQDFDGYVVGDPFFDMPGQILAGRASSALLAAPDSFIPPRLLTLVNQAVYASCDAADGMADGLIQNPANCAFDARSLLCEKGSTASCLTQHQVDTLTTWFSAARDAQGNVAGFGYPVSDVYNRAVPGANLFAWAESSGPPLDRGAPEPWGDVLAQQPSGWAGSDQAFKYLVFLDPNFDSNHDAPVDSQGVVDPAALAKLDASLAAGSADDPQRLAQFLQTNRKLILYHGFSDGFINPFRTIAFYESWAGLVGGYAALARNARLFMVPGMYHCGGGPGPNSFDGVTAAIENWVEHGTVPGELIATKFTNDDPSQPVLRTMPLCPFPTQARHAGTGDVNDAANWSCKPNRDLLQVGPNGASAGLEP